MSTTTHHTTYDPNADAVDVREAVGERDGFFTVSLPVSSNARARDGDAFDVDRLRGFEQQINSDRTVPVFLSHGRSELSEDRYGALGKIGRVTNAGVETRDGATLLTADLEIADPDDLADEGDTGDVEAALRWIRQQFRLGLGAVSVGWDEDTAGRDVPGDAELLEVSIVGIESDTQAQQAAAEPSEAAVRGFEALPTDDQQRDTDPLNRKLWSSDPPTDEERVTEALDILGHVREHHTQDDDDVPPWNRRDDAPPVLSTLAELARQFGHDRDTVKIADRLDDLAGDDHQAERQREAILARLDTVEEHTRQLASGSSHYEHPIGRVRQFPFGRSATESRERIADAVETLRDVLTEDEKFDGWGMAAYMEES